MSHLVIGTESIELQTAIRTIKANLRLLKARMESLNRNSDVAQKIHEFDSASKNRLEAMLKWLKKHEKAKK